LPYVRKAAEEHLGTGLGMLGEMYYLGLGGLVQSDVMALKYFKEGAKAGNVIALNGMGLLSLRSDLTALKSDITEALSYFLKAAEKDYPEAQYNAGKVFSRKYNHRFNGNLLRTACRIKSP
jgi:TPR repeat protein